MNTVEFLRAMWPTAGVYVIATSHPNSKPGGRDWFRHHPFNNIQDAANFVIAEREKSDVQVFYALHTFLTTFERTSKHERKWLDVERVQTNTSHARIFPLDLDVGKSKPGNPKYASQAEALTALKNFAELVKLPKPSIVLSGYGVHVYWRLTADLSSREWQSIANKLQRLCDHHGMLVDRKITTDSSRVLRPIHTWNRKDPANPRRVELKHLSDPIGLDALTASIDAASAGLPIMAPRAVGAMSGIILPEGAPSSAPETPGNVAIAKAMLAAIPPDVGRGVWMKVLWAVAALGWDCGEALARAWSEPGATWDEGEFASVWDSFVPGRGTGPGSLVFLAREYGYAGPALAAGGSVGLAGGASSLTGGTGASGLPSAIDGASEADIANGERLAAEAGGRMLWVRDGGEWLWFSPEAGWLSMPRDGVEGFAIGVVKAMRREAGELHDAAPHDPATKQALQNSKRASARPHMLAMIDMAKAVPGMATSLADFNADPMVLGVRNGVLDLRSGRRRDFAPELRVSKRAAVAFDPAAACPLWDAFLARVLPDQAVRSFLRRFAGYCLTGDVTEHKWVFLLGGGNNGKGVFTETFAWLLGDYARELQPEVLMDDPRAGRNHDPEIMALEGARFVHASETEEGQRLAAAKVKRMTGGDTISGRVPYAKAPRSYKPAFKLLISGNHQPAIPDRSVGTWRRIALVEFGVEIPEHERDPDLPAKLKGEGPGILNWVLAGLAEFTAGGGLRLPAAVKAATEEYQRDEDVLGQFLTECCEPGEGPAFKVPGASLYDAFTGWCSRNGRKHVPTKGWLTRQLKGRRVTVSRDSSTYLGLRLSRHAGGPFPVA